jgi:hypothetical protein
MSKTATRKNTPAQTTATTPQTDRTPRTGDDLHALVGQVLPAMGFETEFSTGSLGYRFVGKAMAQDGVRYQATVQLVRIGTKQS